MITTYDPEGIIFTLGEQILVGWNSISVTRTRPAFNTIYGIRGKHTRTLSYDTSAVMKITLPFSSEWNSYFSDIVTTDMQFGTGRCEVYLKDTGGTSLFVSNEAFVTTFADVSFDATLTERTWTIQCMTTDIFKVGGTTTPTSSILDAINSGISNLF